MLVKTDMSVPVVRAASLGCDSCKYTSKGDSKNKGFSSTNGKAKIIVSMFFFATGEILSAAAGASRGDKYLAIVETSMAGKDRVPRYFLDLTKSVVGEHR